MSLRDGSKKMCKSDPSDYSRINLTDDADAIALKIRKAKTDPEPCPAPKSLTATGAVEAAAEAARPEAFNLIDIYAALSDRTAAVRCLRSSAASHSPTFKNRLTERRGRDPRPHGRRDEAPARRSRPDRRGAEATAPERARALAQPTMHEVEEIVGFLRRLIGGPARPAGGRVAPPNRSRCPRRHSVRAHMIATPIGASICSGRGLTPPAPAAAKRPWRRTTRRAHRPGPASVRRRPSPPGATGAC